MHTHRMSDSCVRGKANPSQATRFRLWADSAGYCQSPTCQKALFVDLQSGSSAHFGEMAHVIAASSDGPRGDASVDEPDLGAWDNLILLCANCHTIADKAPIDHPVEMLHAWKEGRLAVIEAALGIASFASRAEARTAIEPYATQNRYLHRTIGPDNEYRFNPEAEEAAMWQHEMVETVIPNHRRILRIIDANIQLLAPAEKDVVAEYRSHVDGLTYRHQGEGGLKTVLFPKAMEGIFGDS